MKTTSLLLAATMALTISSTVAKAPLQGALIAARDIPRADKVFEKQLNRRADSPAVAAAKAVKALREKLKKDLKEHYNAITEAAKSAAKEAKKTKTSVSTSGSTSGSTLTSHSSLITYTSDAGTIPTVSSTHTVDPVSTGAVVIPSSTSGEISESPTPAACEDVPLDGDVWGCPAQAGWGKCTEPWMVGHCQKSCGVCVGQCEDVQIPDDQYTCAEHAGWGQCGESWMAGYCKKSCNTCAGAIPSPSPSPAASPSPSPIVHTPYTPVPYASPSDWCLDAQPGGGYTCEQQASWGKCSESWMNGYCLKSCGKCPVVENQHTPFNIGELIDPDADAATVQLYNKMKANFGTKIMSGQSETADAGADRDKEMKYIKSITGKTPLLRLFDFIFYTGTNAFDDHSVERAIAWHQKGGIVGFQWHWFTRSGGNNFYTFNTTFDITQAVIPGTPENKLILEDIAVVISKMKILEANGVPVMFRPLHEAAGGWFWWGAKGPAPYLALWDILLTEFSKSSLHNIIWVNNFSGGADPAWYPGDSKVDILSIDRYAKAYDHTPYPFDFYALKALSSGTKILALAENGPLPEPDMMVESGALWAFFGTWNSEFIMTEQFSTDPTKVRVFNHAVVENLVEASV